MQSFAAGSTSGLAVSSTDGQGHGAINASVSLPFVFNQGSFSTPATASVVDALTTPTVTPGMWAFFFSGNVALQEQQISFQPTSPGLVLFATQDDLYLDGQYTGIIINLHFSCMCIVFFSAPGAVTLVAINPNGIEFSGSVYGLGFQLGVSNTQPT